MSCYLTQYFCLISDFENWVKKLFLAYFYRSFSLPHNIAVRRPILKFKTTFSIYIQFSFILYKIDFLYLHCFWVKIAFEVRRSDFVIVFLKQVLRLYSWNQSAALEVGISRNKFVYLKVNLILNLNLNTNLNWGSTQYSTKEKEVDNDSKKWLQKRRRLLNIPQTL